MQKEDGKKLQIVYCVARILLTTLLFALIFPTICVAGRDTIPEDVFAGYFFSWLILPMVCANYWTVRHCRNMLLYFLPHLLVLALQIGVLFTTTDLIGMGDIWFLLGCVLVAEDIVLLAYGLQKRLQGRDELMEDRELWFHPQIAGLVVSVFSYATALLRASRALADIALISLIVSLIAYVIVLHQDRMNAYFAMRKRVQDFPAGRIKGISSGILAVCIGIIVCVGIVSVCFGGSRKYFSPQQREHTWVEDDGSYDKMLQDMLSKYPDLDMVPEEVRQIEPPVWVNMIGFIFAGILMIAVAGSILRAVTENMKRFREGFTENGDIVEDIFVEPVLKKNRTGDRREKEVLSRRQQIRRQYKRMILKHQAKGQKPTASSSPTELERAAGIQGLEKVQRLHILYEDARYNK